MIAVMRSGLVAAGLTLLSFSAALYADQTPIGWLDAIDGNGTASGWALDPDAPGQSIDAHFYVDGPAGSGTFAGAVHANLPRPDVNQVTGYPGDHGFSFSIPASFRDGRAHTLYAHGIDTSGDGGQNVLLSGVPKDFTLAQGQSAIQGFKRDANNQNFNNPGATISISQGGALVGSFGPSVNPYTPQLPAGAYTVESDVPNGYSVAYSLCVNCIQHPDSSYVQGSRTTVNAPAGGYADLWWKYAPVPPPPPPSGGPPIGFTSVNQTSSWQRGQILLKNFDNMYNGHVLYEPGEAYPFKMWFFGWAVADCNPGYSGCDAIFHARSLDGDQWEVYSGSDAAGNPEYDKTMTPSLWAPVVTAQDKYYDQWHNADPSVIRVGNTYYMAFSSTGFNKDGIAEGTPGDTDGDYYCVMGAVSTDGITWQKSPAPILANPGDYGVKEPDDSVQGMYHRPSLMYENGKFRLWFDYWVGGVRGVSMGYAEMAAPASPSNFLTGQWTLLRYGNNPALAQFPNPDVVRVGDTYYAYGDPPQYYDPSPSGVWTARKITEAVSPDGLNWRVTGYIDAEAGCAADEVPEAYFLNGTMYVTYGCQAGGIDANGGYNYRSYQIRRMSKPMTTIMSAIQGFKRDANNQNFNNPGATISISQGGALVGSFGPSVNPYTPQLPAGAYTVESDVPNGYSVAYSLCVNCIQHPDSSYVQGSQVTVNAPARGYADLWWKYAPSNDQYSGPGGGAPTATSTAGSSGNPTPGSSGGSTEGGAGGSAVSGTSTAATTSAASTSSASAAKAARIRHPRNRHVRGAGGSLDGDGGGSGGTGGINDARFVSQDVPSAMAPGQSYNVSVTLLNAGGSAWTEAAQYKLGSQDPQDNFNWGLNRVWLEPNESVAPGQKKTFSFPVTAPVAPGGYDFQWRMVQEGKEWFGDMTPDVLVEVQTNGAAAAKTPVATAANPSPEAAQPGKPSSAAPASGSSGGPGSGAAQSAASPGSAPNAAPGASGTLLIPSASLDCGSQCSGASGTCVPAVAAMLTCGGGRPFEGCPAYYVCCCQDGGQFIH